MTAAITRDASILCIDDEPLLLRILQEGLASRFQKVHTASNLGEAWNVLEKNEIDFIVIDFNMPELSGVATMGRIHEKHPQLPFLMLTGYAEHPEIKNALRSEFFEVFEKPCDIDLLACRVANQLQVARLVRLLIQSNQHKFSAEQLNQLKRFSLQAQAQWLHENLKAS